MYHISLAYAGTPAHGRAHEAEVRLLGERYGGLSYTPNSDVIAFAYDVDDGEIVGTASYCSAMVNDELLVHVAAAIPPMDLDGYPYQLKDMVEYGDRTINYSRLTTREARLEVAHPLNAVIILLAQRRGVRVVLGVGAKIESELFSKIGLDTESVPVNRARVEQTFPDPGWESYFEKERFVHYAHILPDARYEKMRKVLSKSALSMDGEVRSLCEMPM